MCLKPGSIQQLLAKCLFKVPLTDKESKKLDRWSIRTKHYDARQRWSDPRWVAREIDEMGRYKPYLDRVWEKILKKM